VNIHIYQQSGAQFDVCKKSLAVMFTLVEFSNNLLAVVSSRQ